MESILSEMSQTAAIVEQLEDIKEGVIPLPWKGKQVDVKYAKTRNGYVFGCVSDIGYAAADLVKDVSKADKDKIKNAISETLKACGLNFKEKLEEATAKNNEHTQGGYKVGNQVYLNMKSMEAFVNKFTPEKAKKNKAEMLMLLLQLGQTLDKVKVQQKAAIAKAKRTIPEAPAAAEEGQAMTKRPRTTASDEGEADGQAMTRRVRTSDDGGFMVSYYADESAHLRDSVVSKERMVALQREENMLLQEKAAAALAEQRKLHADKLVSVRELENVAKQIEEAKEKRARERAYVRARDDYETKTRKPLTRGGTGWILPYNPEYYVNVETVYDSMLHQYPRQNNDSYAYMLRVIENRAQDIYLERKGAKPTRFMGKGCGVILLCLREEADIIKEAVKTVYRERYGDPQQTLLPFARESSVSSSD